MNRVTALIHVVKDESRPQCERDDAVAALKNLEKESEDRIEQRDAKRALDSLSSTETDDRDFSQENIFRLLWDDGVIDISEQYLRALYLADPKTSIHWAWLKFWRDRLKSTSDILRELAECRIKMLADDEEIPSDVRVASAEFLAQLKQRKHGGTLPPINIPGNERWQTMSNEELYQHMVVHKKSWIDAFCAPR